MIEIRNIWFPKSLQQYFAPLLISSRKLLDIYCFVVKFFKLFTFAAVLKSMVASWRKLFSIYKEIERFK